MCWVGSGDGFGWVVGSGDGLGVGVLCSVVGWFGGSVCVGVLGGCYPPCSKVQVDEVGAHVLASMISTSCPCLKLRRGPGKVVPGAEDLCMGP